MSRIDTIECARARRATHARLDGDALDPQDAARLETHLASCAACRGRAAELEEIQRNLRAVPVPALAADALERVWDQTTRARTGPRTSGRRLARLGAWAAGLALVLGGSVWVVVEQRQRAMIQQAELRRASAEARLVLAVAGSALRRTEQAATDQVLEGGIRHALDRTSIRWSGARAKRPAGGGDGA